MATLMKVKQTPKSQGRCYFKGDTNNSPHLCLLHLHLVFPSLGIAAFTFLCKQRKMLEIAAEQTQVKYRGNVLRAAVTMN